MNRITALALLCAFAMATSAGAQRMNRQQYIEKYKDWAINEMNRTGIPASITLAQGILESDCGNSYLATYANNHFGIKCHDWQGEKAFHDDDKNQECFRKYDSVAQSFADHSDFLTGKSRYSQLFTLDHTDYKGWAHGLKKAGYATDPHYAKRLINIIEETGIHQYDLAKGEATTQTAQKEQSTATTAKTTPTVRIKKDASFSISPFNEHDVRYNNGVKYIEVEKGDTFESIALEFHLMVSELLRYNDLGTEADISKIKYLYIRTKRNRAHPDCVSHEVARGETAWSIAHKYGIKLKKLRKYNHLGNVEPGVGDILYLRGSIR